MHTDQFMIYHLHEWDADKKKWKKKPTGLQGEALSLKGGIPTSTDRAAVQATVTRLGPQYRVGLWLDEASQFFFLDLDDDAVVAGRLSEQATAMAAALVQAGCYFEASSSGRGAHVIGRYRGTLPPHSNSRKSVHPHEFFVRDRGCVLSTDATAGSWDVEPPPALVLALVQEYFPPRLTADSLIALGTGPRPEWRGPVDDDSLILRMLSAAGSAASRLGGKATLKQLWAGDVPHDSESDLALASHLAFWTGADPERIERLMRRSGLKRDKWDEHRTYLRDKTITVACTTTATVYQEPQRVDTVTALLGSPGLPALTPIAAPTTDWYAAIEQATTLINSAGSLQELLEQVVPRIQGFAFPSLLGEPVVTAFIKKAEIFNAKRPVGEVRRLLMPPVDVATLTVTVPEWAQGLVFDLDSDNYFDTATGTTYSQTGLRAAFSRHMPMKQNGQREDVVQWLAERWSITTVAMTEYRPDMPALFESEGRRYANEFVPSSMPVPAIGSDECTACIKLFMEHLAAFVNRRADIYAALLGWIAHNVQHPGIKIRWTPLIQGPGGDGKSILGELLRCTMGSDNVKITSAATLNNSGGFTDWAIGAAVNVMEEMKLDTKEARGLYNSMKNFVGDLRIDVNHKGKTAKRSLTNVTNHMALTNYQNASPISDGDRRMCVIFAPWTSADEAARVKGLRSADDLPAFFERLGQSMRGEPGAWRSWLLNIDLSSFNPNGRAPLTEEREAMRVGSGDFMEQTISDAIANGGQGITKEVFSSRLLMGRVNVDLGEKPDTRSWNRLLSDLGYHQQVSQVWWNGKSHRVWVKKSLTKEQILEIFAATLIPTPGG